MDAARRVAKSMLLVLVATALCLAQQAPLVEKCACPSPPSSTASPTATAPAPGAFGHPHPQMRIEASTATTIGNTTRVITGKSLFQESDPFRYPPGTNFLPTIYTNMFDGFGKEMPNTLPSTPEVPYNLHDGDPVISKIDPRSPTDDLLDVLEIKLPVKSDKSATVPSRKQTKTATQAPATINEEIGKQIQRGLDILEGNPVFDRAYGGLPLLHYKGPEKCKRVTPILDGSGKVVGGNVNIHQVWYDIHIESDTAFLDVTPVKDVPWTITYTVDVLNRGHDDFSPFVMYFDDPALSPPGMPLPHAGMDQSYFNMEEGTRTVFKIKMAPGKYYNLTYTWGWRDHPPRVQVTENACKRMKDASGNNKTLVEWEADVFGENPSASEATKLAAIAKIGDLAPEKRMWSALRVARDAARVRDYETVRAKLNAAHGAYREWKNRNQLPSGVQVDRNADVTLLYVNNTIYAEIIGGGWVDFPKWSLRGTTLKITLLNGDYFEHGYQNVDFGGARGWENQFQSSVKLGGSGCWFTFGRAHWWMNIPGMIVVPPSTPYNSPGMHKVEITYNYEPSRRLRFYQFDPVHHDVAVFSVH